MERFEDLFTSYPSFTCDEIGKAANDFSKIQNAPITFTQANFWIFFALVLLIFSAIHNRQFLRTVFLTAVSCFFYFKTSGIFIVILLFSTLVDYNIGNWIHKSANQKKRKILLITSMFINLTVLAYFKYAFFFTESFNTLFDTDYQFFNHFSYWTNSFWGSEVLCVDKIILPVGISFYTFQTMSYTIDIYRKELTPVKNIIDFGFFVSFFPQLVAGPIVRAKDFIAQIYQPYHLTKEEFGWSIFMIMRGLIKKIVFADYIGAHFVDHIFNHPEYYPGFVIVIGLWGYSMQIYGDFSGYTDIAIGISKLMGFQLNMNFNSPYKATSVADFWRRWHISLSTFLRDYLYIPLGGNKKATWVSYAFVPLIISFLAGVIDYYWDIVIPIGSTEVVFDFWVIGFILLLLTLFGLLFDKMRAFLTTDINLLITMLLGGLWHGASMKFIIWGGLNGIALVIYKYWKRISPYEKSNFFLVHFWKVFITFNFITFTRIFFRANDMEAAGGIMTQIKDNFGLYNNEGVWNGMHWEMLWDSYSVVLIILTIAYLLHWLPGKLKSTFERGFIQLPMVVQGVIVFIVSVAIYQAVSDKFTPFIYFAF